jgi:hypothetical protein
MHAITGASSPFSAVGMPDALVLCMEYYGLPKSVNPAAHVIMACGEYPPVFPTKSAGAIFGVPPN